MSPNLDAKLCADFPLLYRDRYVQPNESCMCEGFPGDGWEPLLRRLSERIEPVIARMQESERPRAFQVKEKFGELRFYVTRETEEIALYIEQACKESVRTC